MQLFHGDAEFLDGKFLLDAGTEEIRLHQFHQFLSLILIKIINNQCVIVHVRDYAFIVLELEPSLFEGLHLFGRLTRFKACFIRFDFKLFNITAVRIHFKVGDDLAAFVIITMGEFVASRDGFHAHLIKKSLIMMGPGSANKHHYSFTFGPSPHLVAELFNRRHFFGNHLFNGGDQLFIAKILGNLAQ